MFPNPTKDVLNFSNPKDHNIKTIEIVNLLGEKIASYSYSNSIDISHISKSVYFVNLIDAQGQNYVRKFIKQ